MSDQLLGRLRQFVNDRDWEQFHDPKNLSMALAAEVGELLACFRWLTPPESEDVLQHEETSKRVLEELGDVAICLMMLCDRLGVSIEEVASEKLALNEARYPVDQARGRATKYSDL